MPTSVRQSSLALGLAVVAGLAAGPARAGLLAYDGFDDTAGASLVGKTAPLGFSSAYTAFGTGPNVSSPGAAYPGLAVTGNKVELAIANANSGAVGVLANAPQTAGSTVYFSYLLQVTAGSGYAGVSLCQGATETLYTGNRSGYFGVDPKTGTAASSATSASNLSLLVCRVDFAAAAATIRLYLNPTSNVEPATASVTVTKTEALSYDRVRIESNSVAGMIDEFRLGTSFADVMPVAGVVPLVVPQQLLVLGSSVAAGTGASQTSEAWAYRLQDLMQNHAPLAPGSTVVWQLNNASVGGDTTSKVLARFQADVVTAHPATKMVIIALSLANEGLVGASNPDAVYNSFKSGLTQIIKLCRDQGYYPMLSLVYPNGGYTASEYGYVKKMNLLLNTWNLPSINLLGALDDGSGRWAAGYFYDGYHPNSLGHGELFYAVVPSLFDAIAAGKTSGPLLQGTNGYLRLQRDAAATSPLRFTPPQTLHSFTLSFRVRSSNPGTIAAVTAGATRATLDMRANSLVYIGPGGVETSIPLTATDGHWHDVALSHRYATATSLVFVDGVLSGTVADNYIPDGFVVGGAAAAAGRALAPLQADFQDVCIYRAAWTQDEAMAQHGGALQQASLEICAPLADAAPHAAAALENRAQSLASLTLNTANFTPQFATNTPDGLTADSFVAGTTSLTWTGHGTGINGFSIERRRSGVAEPWAAVGSQPPSSPNFEDSGLVAGVSYDYRVSAQDGTLQGDYSNVVSITAGGQSAQSYQEWIARYFTPDIPTFLIDFNTNAGPNYGGTIWNTVSSLNSATAYPLTDTNNSNAAGYTVKVSDSFDQFRSDAGAPLTDFPADAQNTLFALRDDVPLTGSFTFGGLDPAATYDFAFFARRGALVAGYDYTGTYTFTGGGTPQVVVVDAASNTALTKVSGLSSTAAGFIVLKISAGPGTGTDFPVINFIQMTRVGGDQTYNLNIKSSSDPDGDGFSNLEEYARNLDPTKVDTKPFAVESFGRSATGSAMELVITKNRRARDISYVLEKSSNMLNWTVDTDATASLISRVGALETTAFSTPATNTTEFFRVRMALVTAAP